MFGLPLLFAAPLTLLALSWLPILYYLLRITPPPPQKIALPTVPLVQDLLTEEQQPRRTPLWLLLLRLLTAASLILALAGPRWSPEPALLDQKGGPFVLFIDSGWAAASDWQERRARAITLLNEANERPVALIASHEEPSDVLLSTAQIAIEKLRSLQPQPHFPAREGHISKLEAFVAKEPSSALVYITDGVSINAQEKTIAALQTAFGARLTLINHESPALIAIRNVKNDPDALIIETIKTEGDALAKPVLIIARDEKGRVLAQTPLLNGATNPQSTRMILPLELRNDIRKIELQESTDSANPASTTRATHHAGASFLIDSSNQRRRVALINGESLDTAQPLISARYFLTQALSPYAELREAKSGLSQLTAVLDEKPDVIFLSDIGAIAGATAENLRHFVEEGGVLVRFAGSSLSAATTQDPLLPIKLRRGGRILGGALSWDKPKRLGEFSEKSPFYGLKISNDVQIERQILAEPIPNLADLTWASLEDGTPLVTAARKGKGQIVLFHVTGDTSWSNLALSGLFVDMLRRILKEAQPQINTNTQNAQSLDTSLLAPRLMLDGMGAFTLPHNLVKALPKNFTGDVSFQHPPGFYGTPEAGKALNALKPETRLFPLDLHGAKSYPLKVEAPLDFRMPLILLACLLFMLDALAVLMLSGKLRDQLPHLRGNIHKTPRGMSAMIALTLLASALIFSSFPEARAQNTPALSPPANTAPASQNPIASKEEIEASLTPRLAYMRTGNAQVDEISRDGLLGLSRILNMRTSIRPADPVGVDPAKQELVFYSLLYWPIVAGAPLPNEQALVKLRAFIQNGGTILFDTRDAFGAKSENALTGEAKALRDILARFEVPELAPIPKDHVILRSFYILERMVGRYTTGENWIEALPPAENDRRPARSGDRVSPLIITSNDLASAWALDARGEPRFPLSPGGQRQRELAFRAGINIVMYAMTGNYKADQVHVPALLERLGQ